MNTDFTDRYLTEEGSQSAFWSFNKKIGAGVIAIAVALILINTTGCTQKEPEVEPMRPVEELPQDSVNVGNDGVNAAIAPDEPAKPLEEKKEDTVSMVAMSIEDTGRADPFLPFNEQSYSYSSKKLAYDLLPPPETITSDTSAVEILGTKVSGIMYDNYNPSAILNIGGSDFLVRSGDVINGYKVLSIAKELVTVQKGANIYKAGVGEALTDGEINYNTISNLESKFGGKKNVANK